MWQQFKVETGIIQVVSMRIYNTKRIKEAIDLKLELIVALMEDQAEAFIDFSAGMISVPLPMQLTFPKMQGDATSKLGLRMNAVFIIVKIASGFYQNSAIGLPAGDGVILIFSQNRIASGYSA